MEWTFYTYPEPKDHISSGAPHAKVEPSFRVEEPEGLVSRCQEQRGAQLRRPGTRLIFLLNDGPRTCLTGFAQAVTAAS
jgi:hypothetical protein